jgi:hypothetical protein
MTWTGTSIAAPGEIITVSLWNSYLGTNSSTQYLINNYRGIYYSSFLGVNGVLNNTNTIMNLTSSTTSHTIPSSFIQGLYCIYAFVVPNTSENATGRRRIRLSINSNIVKTETINAIGLLTSGLYPVTHIGTISPGDIVRIEFLQNSGTSFLYRTAMDIRRVSI